MQLAEALLTLGLDRKHTPTASVITRAFRKQALKYHPDKHRNTTGNEPNFHRITQARDTVLRHLSHHGTHRPPRQAVCPRVTEVEGVRRASIEEEEYRARRDLNHNAQMFHLLYLCGPPQIRVPLELSGLSGKLPHGVHSNNGQLYVQDGQTALRYKALMSPRIRTSLLNVWRKHRRHRSVTSPAKIGLRV